MACLVNDRLVFGQRVEIKNLYRPLPTLHLNHSHFLADAQGDDEWEEAWKNDAKTDAAPNAEAAADAGRGAAIEIRAQFVPSAGASGSAAGRVRLAGSDLS